MAIHPFTFSVSTSITIGEGAIKKIGDEVNKLGARHALLVTSENLNSIGLENEVKGF